MNYDKVDATLASALQQFSAASSNLEVSVRTVAPLNSAQEAELERIGVRGAQAGRTIFSASLSRDALDQLSEKPWIRLLSLAQQLRQL